MSVVVTVLVNVTSDDRRDDRRAARQPTVRRPPRLPATAGSRGRRMSRHRTTPDEGVAPVNHNPDRDAAPVTGDGAPRSVANPRRTQLDASGRPTSAQSASLPQQD